MAIHRNLLRGALVGVGLVFGLVALEVGLRLVYRDGGVPAAHLETASLEQYSGVVEDAEAGYLPKRGPKCEYDLQGCLPNPYKLEAPRAERVLFIGDSVTHRARILKALQKLYGDQKYEYWNAGVESYNTRQELVWLRRYNLEVNPQHVILSFHNNDFRATPLALRENGQFRIYMAGMSINPWLFERSYLYRWAWPRADDSGARAQQVHDSLLEMRDLLAQKKIRLSVILLPMFKPQSQWDRSEQQSRKLSLEYFQELGLRVFDMLEVNEKALQEGLKVTEAEGDFHHPNDALCERFAQELKSRGLLDPN